MPLLGSPSRALSEALSDAIKSRLGIHIGKELFESISLPAHLKIRFAVHDEKSGKEIAASRDLKKILSDFKTEKAENQKAAAKSASWTFGEIASSINLGSSEMESICYPALHDDGDGVMLKYYRTKAAADENHILGATRLYTLNWKTVSKIRPTSSITPDGALYLKSIGYEEKRIADDIKFASAKEAFLAENAPPKTKEQFEESLRDNTRKAESVLSEYMQLFKSIVTECGKCNTVLSIGNIPEETKKSVETQMAWLVFPGFMATIPHEFLKRYQFYFKAIFKRLERAKTNLHGDRTKEARFAPFWEEYKNLAINSAAKIKNRNSFKTYRWMLEEFRISVFAPEIKTAFPVSEQRLAAKLEECQIDY
jgi:ATP-dependent helicase HrpA